MTGESKFDFDALYWLASYTLRLPHFLLCVTPGSILLAGVGLLKLSLRGYDGILGVW